MTISALVLLWLLSATLASTLGLITLCQHRNRCYSNRSPIANWRPLRWPDIVGIITASLIAGPLGSLVALVIFLMVLSS